jgi:hypothetical protein
MIARRAAVVSVAALIAGVVAIFSLSSSAGPRGAEQVAPGAATAAVIRTTLSSRQQVSGSLEHAGSCTLVFQDPTGTVSWLPPPGKVIARGGVLDKVDGQAVRLLYGSQAAYRSLTPGLVGGADVRQLQQNLIALETPRAVRSSRAAVSTGQPRSRSSSGSAATVNNRQANYRLDRSRSSPARRSLTPNSSRSEHRPRPAPRYSR